MADVEQRILEMKLDSSDLEKNAESSIKTIQKLNDAMKFDDATKGFADLDKSIKNTSFEPLNKGIKSIPVDALNKSLKSSVDYLISFKNTVKKAFFEELARPIAQFPMQVANFVVKPFKLLGETINLAKTKGWTRATNIDQAKFQLEGLGANVEELDEAISNSVQDTAYGYDEAAKIASSFYATGIKDAAQMEKYLKGVSGVAAMTNAEYGDIGRIFTTVAGQGRLMGDQLNQLAAKGLNVPATLGEQLHKSEAEIREMVSKGEISFDMFANAMQEAFGDHAKDANKTFEGSMANMKAAIGRIGADFVTPIRQMAIPIFNRLKDVFNGIKATMKEKGIYDNFTRLTENITKLFTTIFGAPKSEEGTKAFNWIIDFASTISSKVAQAIDFINGIIETIIGFFEPVVSVGEKATETVEKVTESIESVDELAHRVISGEFGNGEDRRKALEGIGASYERVQNKVNELLGCSFRYEVAEEEGAKATEKAADAVEKKATLFDKLTEAQTTMGETIKFASDSFQQFKRNIDMNFAIAKGRKALAGFGAAINIVVGGVSAFVKGAAAGFIEALKTIGRWLLTAGAAIGDWLIKVDAWIKQNKIFEKAQTKINNAMGRFNTVLKGAGKVGGTVIDVMKSGWSKVGSVLTQAKESTQGFMAEFKQTSAFRRLTVIFGEIKRQVIELKDQAIQKVLDLIEKFKGTEIKLPTLDADSFAKSVSDKINWILDHISKLKESIKGIFKGGEGGFGKGTIGASIKGFFESTSFQDGLSTVTDLLGKAKDAIVEFFKIFGENASTQISDTGEAFGNFATAAKGFGGDLVSGGKAKLDEFMAWLKEMSPTFKEVGKWIQIAVGNFTALKAIKSFWNLLDWAKKGGEVLDSVKGTVDSVKGVIESFGGIFKSVSSSIQTLTTSLTEIGTAYKKNLKATALLKTAVAVGIFAAALWALGQLSWDQLKVAAAGIAVITGAIALLLGVLGSFGVLGGGSGSIKGAYADQLGEFLMGIKDGVNKFLKKAGSAMMFGAFAAAIAILAHTLKSIGDMKWEQIAKGLAGILGCMMVLMAAMAIMAGITKVMGKDKFSAKQALIMLSLAATIMLVGMSVKRLGKLGKGQLTKGLVAVTVIAFVLGAMMELSKNTKDAKLGPILAMTLAIGTIALAVVALSLLPTDKLAAVTTVMTILMGAFALMMAASGQMKGGGASMIAGIVLMGLVLGEIAAILYLFTSDQNIDADKMLKVSASISLLLGVMGGITLLCQTLGHSGLGGLAASALGVIDIAAVTALITGIAGVVGYLVGDNISEEQIEKAETGLHMIGRILTAITTEFGQMIGGFFGGLIGGSLTGLTENLPQVGQKLSDFVASLGTLATGDGPSFAGFKNLMGFLKDLVDMSDKNTMDNLINNFLGKGDSSLISFGEDLNVFAVLMGMYSEKIQGVNEETINKTSQAISTVTKYANDVPEVGGLMDLFTGDSSLITFGKEAVAFAVYMVAYSNEISGMNVGAVIGTSLAVNSVMQYANAAPTIHGSDSILGKLIGDNSLTALATGLVPFAQAMVAYSWIVSQLNSSAVEQSSKAVGIITDFANAIPNIRLVNTIAGQFFGSNSFEALATGLKSFGEAMVEYGKVVGGDSLDTKAIENSETAGKIITALADSVPNMHDYDTVLGKLVGDNTLITLGTNIESFGTSMVNFSNTLGGIENMSDVESMLNRVQDILSLFGMFSDELMNYDATQAGAAANALTGELEGIFEYFSTMWGDENLTEDIKNGGKTLWERFVEGIKEAAGEAGNEGGGLATIMAGFASTGSEGGEGPLMTTGKSMGEQLILGVRSAFETDTTFSGTDIPTFVLTALESANTALSTLGPSTVSPGVRVTMSAVGRAIVAYGPILQGKIRTICNQMKFVLTSYAAQFESAGKNLVQGLANGLSKNASIATSAGSKVGNDAKNAINKAAEVASPSKATERTGRFLDEGLANGLTKNLYLATNAATSVGASVVGTMQESFGDLNAAAENAGMEILNNLTSVYQYVGSVIENAMDVDPRITPVMDLSNIQNGVGSINSMLGGSTYGLGGLAYARSMYPGTYMNPAAMGAGNNNDMFAVVQGIRGDLNTLGQAMTNMQMVMDSGALVGSISGGIDKELGTVQKLKERWA